ncbi:MAG: Adenosine 5'-monophosphoramidase [Pycnora praestabilis]|nr:MAG: Adenosine 5'-monophosphoramidase [Pycnora praestabilis]
MASGQKPESKPKRQRKRKARTEVSSSSSESSEREKSTSPVPSSGPIATKQIRTENAKEKIGKRTKRETPKERPLDDQEAIKEAPASTVTAETKAEATSFESWYLRKATAEFSEDLNKIRSADDFDDSSLPILIHALKQGVGDIPSFKLFESDKAFAFLDIQPLSKGHAMVIPKHHGAKLTDIPDDQLTDILPVVKKLVAATGAENYNILQNNGRLAHQEVDHVHFHMIPKPNQQEGLGIEWPAEKADMDSLKKLFEQLKSKM